MRIRIVTHAPLPSLKAWYPLDVAALGDRAQAKTVESLKAELVAHLPHVFLAVAPSTLTLELDGFQLLDDSKTQSVLKDGDLVE